jgi:competence protein ComEC
VLVVLAVVAGVGSLQRFEASKPPSEPEGIAVYNDGDVVTLAGTVSNEPDAAETTQRFVLDVAGVWRDDAWQPIDGRVRVVTRQYPEYGYGDIVYFSGKLETPPVFDTFDYREYLANRGIASTAFNPSITVLSHDGGNEATQMLLVLREHLSGSLERALPEPESALARGMLLGERTSIPDEVNDAFNAAGISHLIAISGFNVMLVAGAVLAAMAPVVGRRKAVMIAMGVVAAYAVFVGGSASVLRAMLMAWVMLGAALAGRPGSALTGVVLAGAVLVAWRPLIIEDVSFQLSLGATLGIVLAERPLRERLLTVLVPRLPGGFAAFTAEQAAVTTAATVAVLPIMAASFGSLSLVALPANLVASVVFELALLGSAVASVAGVIDGGLGQLVGQVAFVPLHLLIELAKGTSSLPMASVAIHGFGLVHAVTVYAAIGLAVLWVRRTRQEPVEAPRSLRLRAVPVLAMATFVAAGVVWWGALQPAEHNLRVSILDVGQGDAILIESSSGSRVLVDGGPSGARLMQALGEVLSPSERRIDLMVLTHAQDDHVTGLIDVLRRFEVGGVLWNGIEGTSGAARAWEDEVAREGLPVTIAQAGQVIDAGSGVRIEVVHPQPTLLHGSEDDLNNNAVVLRVVYGDVSFLLTGDIEVDAENAILKAGEDVSATVLKVAHHGSAGATTQPFLDAVSPDIAAVSVGADNPFGHPDPSLRVRLAGVPLLRTDLNGTIRFETDGARLWVDYEHGDIAVVEDGEVAGVR